MNTNIKKIMKAAEENALKIYATWILKEMIIPPIAGPTIPVI